MNDIDITVGDISTALQQHNPDALLQPARDVVISTPPTLAADVKRLF